MAESRQHPKIAVIGAGIIGAAIGYHLAKAGAAPLIFDAEAGGGVATAASWAWLNASWGNRPDYARLRRRSLALWRELGNEVPELPLRFCGSLTYDLTPADLDQFARDFHHDDYPVRIVGPAEIARLEPNLKDRPERAVHCAGEGVAEPLGASQALRRRAVAMGATFVPSTRIEGLSTVGGRIAGIQLGGQTTTVDIVVACAGASSPELLASAGFALPMQSPEGLLVHTQPLSPVLNGLIVAPELHVRQTDQGRLVAGFDFVGTIVDAPGFAACRLIARMNELLRLPEPAMLAFASTGLRPTPSDGFPVIGFVPGVDGLYVAAMHSGMTLAAAVGKFAAGEILSQSSESVLAPYRPGRLTIR